MPDTAVVKGKNADFEYSVTQISCKNIQKVLERNKRKCYLMDFLYSLDNIIGISFTKYFMSSYLDHALYNEQNLDEKLKKDYADAFYDAFEGKEKLFIDFLEEEVSNGVPGTFTASWKYIKEDLHSLERHSNLHIYFKENPYL